MEGYLERKYINKVLEENGFTPYTDGYYLWSELLAAGLSQTEPFLQNHISLCLYLSNKLGMKSPAIVDQNLRRWRTQLQNQEYSNKQLYNKLIHEVLEMEALDLAGKKY